jgi:beta-lactamase class A
MECIILVRLYSCSVLNVGVGQFSAKDTEQGLIQWDKRLDVKRVLAVGATCTLYEYSVLVDNLTIERKFW